MPRLSSVSAQSTVHLYVASRVRLRVSVAGGRCNLQTTDVLMVSINHSWKTEPASYRITFSLYDVSSPQLAMSDFTQHTLVTRKEEFCHIAVYFRLSDKTQDIAQMKTRSPQCEDVYEK